MTLTPVTNPLKFYDTIITVLDSNGNETYNHNIDSDATVKVKLVSKYDGSAVVGISTTVTCTGGKFTKYNGNSITDTQSYSGTTDSNGEFTLTYNCSEWGLHMFSTNTHISTQILISGFKLISTLKTNLTLYYDGNSHNVRLVLNNIPVSVNKNSEITIASLPASYIPKTHIKQPINNNCTLLLWVNSSGNIMIHNNSSTNISNYSSYCQMDYTV